MCKPDPGRDGQALVGESFGAKLALGVGKRRLPEKEFPKTAIQTLSGWRPVIRSMGVHNGNPGKEGSNQVWLGLQSRVAEREEMR